MRGPRGGASTAIIRRGSLSMLVRANPGLSTHRMSDPSVLADVLVVRPDELPYDVGVPEALALAEPEHGAILAGEADRPDVLAAQLMETERGPNHGWVEPAVAEIASE